MGRKQRVITEGIYTNAQNALNTMKVSDRVRTRLKALLSAKDNGITLTAKILKISSAIIRIWAKRFDAEGIEGLEYRAGRGRRSNLPKSKHSIIREWVTQDPSITLKEIVIKLQEEFAIKTSITAMHGIFVKLGLAYITPRPVHYKQNKKAQNEFKKKSIATI